MRTRNFPKHPGVYAIRHVESGKAYIGSSNNIYHRWRLHLCMLRRGDHHSPKLQNSWNKYGEAAFVFEAVEMSLNDPVLLCAREQHWMDRFKGRLLNCAKHPETRTCRPIPEAQKAVMRVKMLGNRNGAGSHYCGRLTETEVVAILTRYAAGDDLRTMAKEYGVHVATITRIATRRIWYRTEVSPEVSAACDLRHNTRNRGDKNAITKIGEAAALLIKRRLLAGECGAAIAREFGVTPNAISAIKHGKSYAYLSIGKTAPTESETLAVADRREDAPRLPLEGGLL